MQGYVHCNGGPGTLCCRQRFDNGEARTMATIGFVGLGLMGGGMSRNILKGGHGVRAYDLDADAVSAIAAEGAVACASAAEVSSTSSTRVTRPCDGLRAVCV